MAPVRSMSGVPAYGIQAPDVVQHYLRHWNRVSVFVAHVNAMSEVGDELDVIKTPCRESAVAASPAPRAAPHRRADRRAVRGDRGGRGALAEARKELDLFRRASPEGRRHTGELRATGAPRTRPTKLAIELLGPDQQKVAAERESGPPHAAAPASAMRDSAGRRVSRMYGLWPHWGKLVRLLQTATTFAKRSPTGVAA